MIDPIHSLAFTIHANPGVYAVLVGSGLSRAAKIPTGWEITMDLVRKLATVRKETCEPDPERWYVDTFDEPADYSKILDEIAKTPAERQQLLRRYWEPNAQEIEDGDKQPTPAHREIAKLAKHGFIKVIITTNFDRLLESALVEQGMTPTVLSSPDQIHGSLPLIHTRCCVFKLHGDYLDTRIRNTASELDKYPEEFDSILDRIFDEFGLIVCGWSAAWDEALRKAIERASSRRFMTYWATKGEPSDQARRLIELRGAQVIQIEDADKFFTAVQQHVQSIEEFSMPHPLSVEAAVMTLKRYISEARHRIRLSDLVDESVGHVIGAISGEVFSANPRPTSEAITSRVRSYEAACSNLLAMAAVGGYWAEEEHHDVWRRALRRLGSVGSTETSYGIWHGLTLYPATLLLYTLGLGAVERGRLRFLAHLLKTVLREEHRDEKLAVQKLPPFCLPGAIYAQDEMRLLEGMKLRYAPLNDWLLQALWQHVTRVIPDKKHYEVIFDQLEALIALGYLHHTDEPVAWAPPGAFCYRHENRGRFMKQVEESLSREKTESPYVVCRIFGETVGECGRNMKKLKEFIPELRWR